MKHDTAGDKADHARPPVQEGVHGRHITLGRYNPQFEIFPETQVAFLLKKKFCIKKDV